MAEVILPGEEENNVPVLPEIVLEMPGINSKVIEVIFDPLNTRKTTIVNTSEAFFTTDTDAWLEFTANGLTDATGIYSLVIRNRDDGSSFQRVGDMVNGKAYYKLKEQEIRHAGHWVGQMYTTLANGQSTAAQFRFSVEGHILDGRDVRETVVEDFQTLMAQLQGVKGQAEMDLADLKADLSLSTVEAEQLIADTNELKLVYDELLETGVLQTNINEKLTELETTYAPRLTTLEQNDVSLTAQLQQTEQSLNAQLAQTTKYSNQVDYVDLIKNRTSYKNMRVTKYESVPGVFVLKVYCYAGNQHVSYEFRKNPTDDFWVLLNGYLGKLRTSPINKTSNIESTTGTWTNIDGSNNRHTTEIGSTFTFEVEGESVSFGHLADSRGGIFDFVINGDTSNPITISTYSDVLKEITSVIKSDLEIGKIHTITGTFKGADPENPPTDTARGWVKDGYTGDNLNRYTAVGGYIDNGGYNNNIMGLGHNSNKEFAFQITDNGVTNWFPEHNGIGTAYENEPIRFILDGEELILNAMPLNVPINGENLQVVQNVKCRFPNATEDIANLSITHSVSKNGVVGISGSIEYLKAVTIEKGYAMMLPLVNNQLKDLVTSMGDVKESIGDGSNTYFNEDGDRIHSFAGVDSRNPDIITAMTIDFPYKTLRMGESNRGMTDSFFFFQNRNDYPKLYPSVYINHSTSIGEKYSFYGKYTMGNIKNIHGQLTLKQTAK